jgi:molybdopterin-guanine dinucleotide biosynthesis protein A
VTSHDPPARDGHSDDDVAADRTTGVILAGGTSQRFGPGDKALATLDGVPMIRHVASRIQTVTDELVVAVRTNEQREAVATALDGVSAVLVVDHPAYAGPVAGLRTTLEVAGSPWVFVTACDMPFVDPGVVRRLADYRSPAASAVVPVTASLEPLHAFYRFDALATTLPDHPSAVGLHRLLDALPTVYRVAVANEPDSRAFRRSLTNVNRRADLDELGVATDPSAGLPLPRGGVCGH